MLAAPCFNWVRHNGFSSIMLHGLRAALRGSPGTCSVAFPKHMFLGKSSWMQGSARGWSWHSRKQEAEPVLSLVTVTSACALVAFRILSLVLAGLELQPLCSPLLLLPCFSTSAVLPSPPVSYCKRVFLFICSHAKHFLIFCLCFKIQIKRYLKHGFLFMFLPSESLYFVPWKPN